MEGKLAPIAGQDELADMYEHVIEVKIRNKSAWTKQTPYACPNSNVDHNECSTLLQLDDCEAWILSL
jgi:hypothetical protein